MFSAKSQTVNIDGLEVELRQLSLGETNGLQEDDDMAVVVALSWAGPDSVTAEKVRSWPTTVVKQLYDICLELNGLDEGN